MKFRIAKRTIYQTISLLALHSAWGMEAKWFCNPVLSCHSCALSWFACPIGVLVHYPAIYHVFPFIAVGTVLLIGALVGRLLCGWVCPFGFVQDLLYKIPTRKFWLPKWMNNIKYLVLILGVFLLPFLFGEFASFCSICPAAALQVTVPDAIASGLQITGTMKFVKLGIVLAVLATAILYSRVFCRVLCPIGALLAPLNYLSLWVVGPLRESCLTCQGCDKVCLTAVQPSKRLMDGISANRTLDCVVCHDCLGPCRKTLKVKPKRATAKP